MVEEKNKKKKYPLFSFGLNKEKDFFIENLSVMISSGMGVSMAVEAIKKDVRTRAMAIMLDNLEEDIYSGSPLWKSLERSNLFPTHIISLIRIGEQGGKLSINLKVAAMQQEKDRSFKSKVQSAMMYPVFVLGLTAFIGIGIAWFILPRLSSVFSQLNLKLPLITEVLIDLGDFLGAYGIIVAPILVFTFLLMIYLLFVVRKTRFIGQILLFHTPIVGRLVREVELARMGHLLGTILKSGLPVTEALSSMHEATLSPQYKKFYLELRDSVDEGNSFEKSFILLKRTGKLIPNPIQQMIIVGEKSGNLPDILLKLGEMFEAKTDITTKNMAVILEPILLVIVWLGVVSVALAVILPIYSLVGGLNESRNPTDSVVVEKEPIPEVNVGDSILGEVGEIILRDFKVKDDLGFLNVRSGPGSEYEKVGEVLSGDVVLEAESSGSWIKFDPKENFPEGGWVHIDFLEIIE